MGLNITGFGSLNFGKPASREIAWTPNQPIHDPAAEADVRRIIYDQCTLATGWANSDNKDDRGWGPDLEPRSGRVFRAREAVNTPELKGGVMTPAFALDFDPNNSNQFLSLDLNSKEGNYSKHVTWAQGEFESCQEERVLANGDKEVLKLQVDRATDTLTFLTEVIKAGS
ncbi:MAG: hypothetical protein U0931_17980 [Vulcanimicrobiota bacterium]